MRAETGGMGGEDERRRRRAAIDLRINAVLAVLSFASLVIGLFIGNGLVVGISLILLIFFATYALYGYLRRTMG